MRTLLKKKTKWSWTAEHEEEFAMTKKNKTVFKMGFRTEKKIYLNFIFKKSQVQEPPNPSHHPKILCSSDIQIESRFCYL
jgi:hypothetical protein